MDNITEHFTLIDGHFDPSGAKEVLVALVTEKINYHNRKNFSHEERFGVPDQHSLARIEQLKEARRQLVDYLGRLDKSQELEVTSQIFVTVKQTA
ncbi:MAG: hypothetical protein KDC07_04035 [Chitinophagaceae bacterium]|nr:hypothetical protein [Chitinophagaceae bacterium]MCB9045014.1 hypothetical protein [Chitinophagales bacterium]